VTTVHPQTFGTVGAVTDPVLLGIHPAIPLKLSVEGLNSQLPTYIRRDIDTDLRTALRKDLSRGGFIVLAGREACGKSRTAYEAIKAELSAWRIFVPAEAAEVNGLAEAEIGDGRIIAWVDELLPLLNDPDLSIRAFRELIGNPGRPVVIIGTMWPEHHDQLSEQPMQAQPDPFRAARWLLKLAPALGPSGFAERGGSPRDEVPQRHRSENQRGGALCGRWSVTDRRSSVRARPDISIHDRTQLAWKTCRRGGR